MFATTVEVKVHFGARATTERISASEQAQVDAIRLSIITGERSVRQIQITQ